MAGKKGKGSVKKAKSSDALTEISIQDVHDFHVERMKSRAKSAAGKAKSLREKLDKLV